MKINNFLSTSTDGDLNRDILLEQYQREFNLQSKPFLLCDIFDMKENMHTNLLEHLLIYNNYMLLPSFVEKVLGIDSLSTKEFIESGDVYVTTQLKALGNKKDTWGLVDLVIGIGDTDIIIENKVNGAVDVKNQLARYVASMLFVRVTSPYNAAGQFDPDWYDALEDNKKRIIDKKLQNLYVYYLTKHESDENPSHSSFSGSIKTQLERLGHFRKISYENDLYQWLESIVLVIHTPFHRLSNKAKNLKVSLAITHLSPAFFQSKQKADIRNTADRLVAQLASEEDYANPDTWDAHNHIFRVVYQKNFDIQGKDFNDKEARVALYKDIIRKLASSIEKIDNALQNIEH